MNITKGDVQELRRRLKKTECTFGRLWLLRQQRQADRDQVHRAVFRTGRG